MQTKEGTTFVPEDPTFPLPRIKQAVDGQVTSHLLEDCTIIAPIPSSAERGEKISYSLVIEYVGAFFQTPSTVIDQELLDKGEVMWQVYPWKFILRPGADVWVRYTIEKEDDDRYESPRQEYIVGEDK